MHFISTIKGTCLNNKIYTAQYEAILVGLEKY